MCARGHMYDMIGDLCIIGEEMLLRGVGLMDEERTYTAFGGGWGGGVNRSTTMRLLLDTARIELRPC